MPGQYSDELFRWTSDPKYAGTWTIHIATGPGGPETGSGALDATGHGSIDIRIFNFGQRDHRNAFEGVQSAQHVGNVRRTSQSSFLAILAQ